MVNTTGGDGSCWRIAKLLEKNMWDCTVDEVAISAGLIMTVACRGTRTCAPGSLFVFHGDDTRDYERSNPARAEWFAARTKMPYEFWLEHAGAKHAFQFGAEEALECGVIHEIGDLDTSTRAPGL